MATQHTKSRICDTCGKVESHLLEECDTYFNSFGKKCTAAPKGSMLILSVPYEGSRAFLDFCCVDCLLAWYSKDKQQEKGPKVRT